MSRLSQKVVLITGASSGIGEACASAFAREGASVVLGARRLERLNAIADKLSTEYGVPILPIRLDVTDAESCEHFISQLEKFGQIDVLVNNAGVARARHGCESARIGYARNVRDQCFCSASAHATGTGFNVEERFGTHHQHWQCGGLCDLRRRCIILRNQVRRARHQRSLAIRTTPENISA